MDELKAIANELVSMTGDEKLLSVVFPEDHSDDKDYHRHCWVNLYDLMSFFSGRHKIPQELFERLLSVQNKYE